MGNRLLRKIHGQGEITNGDTQRKSFHEVSGAKVSAPGQKETPTALPPCHLSHILPSSRAAFQQPGSTLARLKALPGEEQLLHLAERPHLAVDIHLPVGQEVLDNIVVPLLGSQVQTRGALRILDTSTEQALRDHPQKVVLFQPKIFCLYIFLLFLLARGLTQHLVAGQKGLRASTVTKTHSACSHVPRDRG